MLVPLVALESTWTQRTDQAAAAAAAVSLVQADSAATVAQPVSTEAAAADRAPTSQTELVVPVLTA